MKDITIPPAALEAAARAICEDAGMERHCKIACPLCKVNARAACLAMLEAWPGMELDEAMWSGGTSFIVIPLTQENSDEG